MAEFAPETIRHLQQLIKEGFSIVAFPMYERYVGVRKGNCAVLLQPQLNGRLCFYNRPCYLVEGHLSAYVEKAGKKWFVWKSHRLEATPERLDELLRFEEHLQQVLNLL
jgi:hypothetical protein